MLHVTATAASESRNDGAVRRNCYWLDRGVAHITSERKRVGGLPNPLTPCPVSFWFFNRMIEVQLNLSVPPHTINANHHLELPPRQKKRSIFLE